MTLRYNYLPTHNSVQSYIASYYNIPQLYSKYNYKWAYLDNAPLGLIYPTFIFGYKDQHEYPVSSAYIYYSTIDYKVL